MKLCLAALLAILASHAVLVASDHIDGPVTINHAVADITDLFAFPSPDYPGHLTLILNVYTAVAVDGHFSDRVTYRFLVRHASVRGNGQEPGFETSGDYHVSCSLETPHTPFSAHWITCTSSKGTTVRQQVDEVGGQDVNGSLRVFAGRRSDPFFFNSDWAVSAAKGILLPPKDDNVMQDLNILSIVLVVDIEKEVGLSDGSLFAIAAETTSQDDDAAATRRIDRIGRPEITNVSMAAHGGEELRDLYNAQKPFILAGENVERFRRRLCENVHFYDKLNGTIQRTPESGNQLAEILLNDFLVVDVSKPFSDHTYFEIEDSILRGEMNATCGGRVPNDDVMDVIFTTLINGGNPPAVRDGVDRPTRLATKAFPYLAAPNNGIRTALKSFIGRAAGKLSIPGRMRWTGIMQLVSGATALLGMMLLVYYGFRQGIARALKRKYPAAKRARVLRIMALLFGIAIVFGVITAAFSLRGIGLLAVILVITQCRFLIWKNKR